MTRAVRLSLTASVATFALALLSLPATASGIERSFEMAPGGRLEIDSEGASVEVSTHEGAGARVTVTRGSDSEERILADYRVDIRQDGDLLRVELERLRPGRLFDFHMRSPEIEVELPRRFDAAVETSGGAIVIDDLEGSVDAHTSGGSVILRAISGPVVANTSGGSIKLQSSGGDADLKTSGGSIVVGEVGGTVYAKTSGGSISIERAAGPVAAHTSGGSIEIHEVRGAIDASTSGGSVRAYLAEPPGADSQLRTSGGGITVMLDDGIGVDLDARGSGRVQSDFDVASGGRSRRSGEELIGEINGGGPLLMLRTSGGGIHIRRH